MDKQVQQEIRQILDLLDNKKDVSPALPDENEQGTEVIDVFIVRRQGEEAEPPTVEGTLAHSSVEPVAQAGPAEQGTAGQETTGSAFLHLARKSRRYLALPFVIGALCLLLALASGLMTLLFVLAPSASVMIVPTSMQIATTRTVTVVPANASAARQEVPGRALPTISLSQAMMILATGTGHQQALAAQGFITFYNALPTPQTIPAGELLTGADGIEVTTLQDAVIPAGMLATNGQVTIPAQAVNAGPQGNIRTGDIYGKCCRDDVFAVNGPFRGGRNARSYQMVTQQDIDGAASSLKTSLDLSVQATLGQQAQSNETLVSPVPCTSMVTSDHKADEEARRVQITVNETCIGEVYVTEALHGLLVQTVTQQVTKQAGEGYALVGNLQTSITRVVMNPRQGTVILQLRVISTWIYQFSQARQDQIKLAVRGKSKDEATALLLHMSGVQTVSISTRNGNAIPTDIQHIHLNFVILA